MSFARMKYLHNSTLCAQIFHINPNFIDIPYIPICDGFEILEKQMQSIALYAIHPEKAFVELHGAQPVGTPAFGTSPPFFHQVSRACGTACQRHWGKTQWCCFQGYYWCASGKSKAGDLCWPHQYHLLCWRVNMNLLHWYLQSPALFQAPVIQHAGIQLREATGVKWMKSGDDTFFLRSLSSRRK